MSMRTNYYIKDSERRAFVACRLTHAYTTFTAGFNPQSGKWYHLGCDCTYKAVGVLATDPDTEVCMSTRSLYFEPTGDATHCTGGYLAESDRQTRRNSASKLTGQYWAWDESAAKAVHCERADFQYDYVTGEVTLKDDLESKGYVYPSKEAAEADHLYAVIEFGAPKAKKTYTVTKTKTETYIVEADSVKAAQEAMAAGRSKKKGVKYNTSYEKTK